MTRRGVGTKREMGDNEREMIIVVCNVVCFLTDHNKFYKLFHTCTYIRSVCLM